MPKSKSRGKRYTPKMVSANSMEWAMAGAHLLPVARRDELFAPVSEGFEALRKGTASTDQWYTVDNGLRLSEALIELNIGNNLAPQITDGRRALDAVGLRLRTSRSSTCRSSELALIREAVDLYKIQLGLCTQAEMSKAVRRVRQKITGLGLGARIDEEACHA